MLQDSRYKKFRDSLDATEWLKNKAKATGDEPVKLPERKPNMNIALENVGGVQPILPAGEQIMFIRPDGSEATWLELTENERQKFATENEESFVALSLSGKLIPEISEEQEKGL